MRKATRIRFLIPKRVHKSGRIDYHVETRTIRLPLRRGDRRQLLERLEN